MVAEVLSMSSFIQVNMQNTNYIHVSANNQAVEDYTVSSYYNKKIFLEDCTCKCTFPKRTDQMDLGSSKMLV